MTPTRFKLSLPFLCVIVPSFIIGCTPPEDRIRQLIAEELAAHGKRSFMTETQTIGPYSPAVQVGRLLFVSGQVGLDPATGKVVDGGIEAEAKQALTNLIGVLRKSGFDSSHVVQCSVFLTDMKDFPKMNLIYGGFFAEGSYPARATVEVRALPREAHVEIAAVAFK